MGLIGFVDDFIDWVKKQLKDIRSAISDAFYRACRYADKLVSGIERVVYNVTQNVTQFVTNVTNKIFQTYQTFITNVTQVYNNITQRIHQTYQTFITNVTQVIGLKIEDVRSAIQGGPEWLSQGVFKAVEPWVQAFNRGFEEGLEEGLKDLQRES